AAILDLGDQDATAAGRTVGTALALVDEPVGVAGLDLTREVEPGLVDLRECGNELDTLARREVGCLVADDRLVQRAALLADARGVHRVQFDGGQAARALAAHLRA